MKQIIPEIPIVPQSSGNGKVLLVVAAVAVAAIIGYTIYKRKKDEEKES